MSRPQKCRFVCGLPKNLGFSPDKEIAECEIIELTVDEYEVIRLIDYENLTQEECGERMQVARTTAQSIYDNARKKIADCLVNGKKMVIKGGEYKLCPHAKSGCRNGCPKCKKILKEMEEK